MKVTVIVVTFQRPLLLVQSLAAILRNGYDHFELVVIDQSLDGSTRLAVEESFPHEPRLQYVHSETVGLATGRNLGLSLATGDLVLFTDDDTIVGDQWIAAHVRCHERLQRERIAPGVVGGPLECLCLVAKPGWWPDDFLYLLGEFGLEPGRNAFVGGELPATANCSCARLLLEKVDGFDERLGHSANRPALLTLTGEDSAVAIQLHRMGYHVHFCPEASVKHCLPPDKLTPCGFAKRVLREGATQTAIDRFVPGAVAQGFGKVILRNVALTIRSFLRILLGCPLAGESLFGKRAARELARGLMAIGRIWGLVLLVMLRRKPRRQLQVARDYGSLVHRQNRM